MFLYDNLPIYLLIFLVFFFVSIFVYIKLAFPFWNIQPVYHVYDFWRCLYSRPFRIYKSFHPKIKTKYCHPEKVDIIPFVDASLEDKKAFVNLIQCYSVPNENAMCMFHLENLEAYMSGHIYGSYLSFYKDVHFIAKDGEIVKGTKPRGCVGSRSGVLIIMGHKENIYWLDPMITDRESGSGVYRELFETHIYKIGFLGWKMLDTDPICVWIFKRSGVLLDGILPFVRFSNRVYEIPNNPGFFNTTYPEHVVLVDCHKGNMRKLIDGLEIVRGKYGVFGMMDMPCLEGLILKGVFRVYILERKGDLLGLYLFRDTRIVMENIGSVVELAGCVWLGGSIELFRAGFLDAVSRLDGPRLLKTDNLTDSGLLDWTAWFLLEKESGAYYAWNLVIPISSSSIGSVFLLF